MLQKYYVVGAAVRDLQFSFFSGATPKTIGRQELLKSLFANQKSIRLFPELEKAQKYARGLRHNENAFSDGLIIPAKYSKVHPVFTLELELEEQTLGVLKTESFTYFECFVDGRNIRQRAKKEIELSFYEVTLPNNLISEKHIIQVNFLDSEAQQSSNQACCVV